MSITEPVDVNSLRDVEQALAPVQAAPFVKKKLQYFQKQTEEEADAAARAKAGHRRRNSTGGSNGGGVGSLLSFWKQKELGIDQFIGLILHYIYY